MANKELVAFDTEVDNTITDFLNLLRNVNQFYEYNLEMMKEQDKLSQDLLHEIEYGEIGYKERCKMATKLKENRMDRRYFKDRVGTYEPLYNLLNDKETKDLMKKAMGKLQEALGAIRKEEKYHKNRFYVPKFMKEKVYGEVSEDTCDNNDN